VPTQTVTPTAVLPPQVSPPAFALSALPPHELGVEVLALPFTVDDGTPVLGLGAGEAAEALGLDLSGMLVTRRAKGTGGEVVPVAAENVAVIPHPFRMIKSIKHFRGGLIRTYPHPNSMGLPIAGTGNP